MNTLMTDRELQLKKDLMNLQLDYSQLLERYQIAVARCGRIEAINATDDVVEPKRKK